MVDNTKNWVQAGKQCGEARETAMIKVNIKSKLHVFFKEFYLYNKCWVSTR